MNTAIQPVQGVESRPNQSDTTHAHVRRRHHGNQRFEVEDADLYIFSQYFDQEEIFAELREYYNSEQYRFEIPADKIDRIESFLDEYFYALNRVAPDAVEPFCVVKEKYTDHADILRNSVYHTSQGSNTVFVMQDRLSAEHAIEQGATPLADADTSFQL